MTDQLEEIGNIIGNYLSDDISYDIMSKEDRVEFILTFEQHHASGGFKNHLLQMLQANQKELKDYVEQEVQVAVISLAMCAWVRGYCENA